MSVQSPELEVPVAIYTFTPVVSIYILPNAAGVLAGAPDPEETGISTKSRWVEALAYIRTGVVPSELDTPVKVGTEFSSRAALAIG